MSTTTTLPLENIIHRTGANPFSIHYTGIATADNNALYLHCHPEAEFFLLEKGELLFHVENQSFPLHAGDAIFIPPNLIHSAERSRQTPCGFHAIVFSTELPEQFFTSHKQFFAPLYQNRLQCIYPIYSSVPDNRLLLQHLNTMLAYQNTPLETYELAMIGTLLICWQELFNLSFSHINTTPDPEALQVQLQKSLDFILMHFAEPISLTELSNQSGYSEGYFCHSFKSFTGYSPFEYLNRVRIAKSCDLLIQTNQKITDIALQCGFSNISYFNRTFHRLIGHTPSAYRKGIRG